MEKKINIMYVIDAFCDSGGTETHLTRLVTLLNPKRFNCMIVAFDMRENFLLTRIRDAGVRITHIPVGCYYNLNAIKKGIILSKIIRDNHIDIVQTFHFKSDFYGALIAYLSGTRHIISSKRDIGDLKTSFHFLLNSATNWFFDGYIAVSDAVAEIVSDKEKVSLDRIKTIYNGVDTELFTAPDQKTREEARQRLDIGSKDCAVGMVAALRPEKNHPIFFEAIRKARGLVKDIKAIVVGGGVLLNDYRDLCRNLGILDDVIFTGWSDNVIPYLNAFDIACLIPGKNEGFSNSIIEKMAMGLPLIVTDIGGNAEAVIDDFNGYVIPHDNATDLSNAILKLCKDPELRREMGMRSRNRILEKFTLNKMVKDHEEYYEVMLDSSGKQ